MIEDDLHQLSAYQRQMAQRSPVELITISRNGLQPGVDLDDSAALPELMEAFNDPTRR